MKQNNRPKRPSVNLVRASYGPRVLTLALGFVAIASVLITRPTPGWIWLALGLHCLVWPHLAWHRLQKAADPAATENRNLLIDHFLGGIWVAVMAFNALPSALILTVAGSRSMAAGGLRQFFRAVVMQAIGIAAGLLVYQVQWQPATSMLEILACLPLLILHPLLIAHVGRQTEANFQRQQQKLAHQNRHDNLSGLYNRRHWDACVRAEFLRFQRTGEPATLVMLDFDHFKPINDMMGHLAGDEVIRSFGQRLRNVLRDTDTPGRYGGDEFSILLPHTTCHDAETLMQRLQKSLLTRPLHEQCVVTISVGIAQLTPEVRTAEAWVHLADQMLYRAKYQGRGRVVTAGVDSQGSEQPASDENQKLLYSIRAPNRVLAGLELGDIGVALFDPTDRLIWANSVFRDLFLVSPEARTFADIMRGCHTQQRGPRIECEDITVWLSAADAKRRSEQHRSFVIDIHDGRYFQVEENSFENGWILDLFIPHLKPPDH